MYYIMNNPGSKSKLYGARGAGWSQSVQRQMLDQTWSQPK